MATPLHRGRHRGRRSLLRAAAVALTVSVAASLSAIAPDNDLAIGVSPGGNSRGHAVPAALGAAARSGPVVVASPREAADPARAVAPVAATPHAAVKTMSMDAPIQGGLTAHQAQAKSAAVLAGHGEVATAAASSTWTPAMGRTALARARSWLGMPYSWAGGSASGPTAGRCDTENGADLDCHIVGFDCSGLMMYAWGPYAALPHFAQTQRDAGLFHPSVDQLRAGDLVFFSGYLPGGIGHVAIYEGHGMVIEAPQSGDVVRRSALSDLMAGDGTYRGAVRPLTTATPTLAAPAAEVPNRGGTVTLRGTDLSAVTSLTVGTRTVRSFERRSDSAIVVRLPRSPGSRSITVTARTSWGATSEPVVLTYAAAPARTTPAPKPTRSAPPTRAPKPTVPPTSAPKPTAPVTPKPTPTPAPSTTPVTSPGSTTTVPPSKTSSAASTSPAG